MIAFEVFSSRAEWGIATPDTDTKQIVSEQDGKAETNVSLS
jgi:hypothetical protein